MEIEKIKKCLWGKQTKCKVFGTKGVILMLSFENILTLRLLSMLPGRRSLVKNKKVIHLSATRHTNNNLV
jgi:hypothetical protein